MPSERTFVTELATGLGMLGDNDVVTVLERQPAELVNLSQRDWAHLRGLWESGRYGREFLEGFLNGRAFFWASDALNGRRPRRIEWTGGRRPPGDEVVPSDLRVDHVYLVSCKYLSRILHNSSPSRLVEALLAWTGSDDADWYARMAPEEYHELYRRCASVRPGLPSDVCELSSSQRKELAGCLSGGWPPAAAVAYQRLCEVVAERTAAAWQASIGRVNPEVVVWRLLRIGSAPYFILGTGDKLKPTRLRIDTPWDWRQQFRLRAFEVWPQPAGQPRVGWRIVYERISDGVVNTVVGHVELRWGHGRFAQPPEAKVYLDTRHEDVPGYHMLL
jgi:hypothetical protein